MTIEQKALLDIVKIGATGECLFGEAVLYADWKKLFELSCWQGVVCVAWHGIEILYRHEVNECPHEVKLQWYAASQKLEDNAKKYVYKVAAFASDVAPIELVVLKGMDYCRFWPNAEWRECGDLDVVVVESGEVRGESSEALDKKAAEIGLKVEDYDYKHTHIYYKDLMVENHHSFTSFAGSQEALTLEKELRQLFAVSDNKVLDANVLTPSVNFTAVFLLAHAQNHFLYEGMCLKHILDWCFFLQQEGRNVDWSVVKPVLEKTGLAAFAVLLTQYCNKHFGLHFGKCSAYDDELLAKFSEDLFGKKYNDHDRRWWAMIERMFHRYKRLWLFREFGRMPVHKAVWRSMVYSSIWKRKPELK